MAGLVVLQVVSLAVIALEGRSLWQNVRFPFGVVALVALVRRFVPPACGFV